MDPEDIPTGFPYAEEPSAAERDRAVADDDVDEIRERVQAALCSGPQCASSVLATRYAKILRQERLLAMAAAALKALEPFANRHFDPEVDRSAAIRRQIDEERKNPA